MWSLPGQSVRRRAHPSCSRSGQADENANPSLQNSSEQKYLKETEVTAKYMQVGYQQVQENEKQSFRSKFIESGRRFGSRHLSNQIRIRIHVEYEKQLKNAIDFIVDLCEGLQSQGLPTEETFSSSKNSLFWEEGHLSFPDPNSESVSGSMDSDSFGSGSQSEFDPHLQNWREAFTVKTNVDEQIVNK